MPAFLTIVFLCGVAATLIFKAWLKGREAAAKARIAREDAATQEEAEAPRRRRGKKN